MKFVYSQDLTTYLKKRLIESMGIQQAAELLIGTISSNKISLSTGGTTVLLYLCLGTLLYIKVFCNFSSSGSIRAYC